MNFSSGTRLGRYEIRSLLGTGGMGEVYLAQDTQLERLVALKVMPPGVADDIGRVRRFTQEARAASALNHPHILTIFEIGEIDSHHFIATEFIEGETLRQHIKSGTLQLSDVLNIATQVSDALSAAHEVGIVHRDIKPENIMMRRRDGYIKVLDFGLAKLTAPEPLMVDTEAPTKVIAITDPGTVFGTVYYMSPEQARGQSLDARTDIFSLGVVIYEMVAGRPPFEGQTKTDVVNSIIGKEPAPLQRYAREVPDTLEWIVSKALRKDKEERYQTARELLTDLRSLKQRLEFAAEQERSLPLPPVSLSAGVITAAGTQASVATLEGPHTQTEMAARPMTSAEYLVSKVKQHKRGVILVVAALLLAVAGVIVGLKYMGRVQTASEPFGSIKLTRLTSTGKSRWAIISPDGKYIVHVMGDQDQQSLWLRHIATGSDKEIAPSIDGSYSCPTFSPDGNYVYYLKEQANLPTVVYQLPVLGGVPRKIMDDVDSVPAFSPDGKRMFFMRGKPAGTVEMTVANMDGSGERVIGTTSLIDFTVSYGPVKPAWSPDGETIVLGVPASDTEGNYRQMIAIHVRDETVIPISPKRWSALGQFSWLANGSGFIFTASDEGPGTPLQIWHMSYPSGRLRRITNDLNDYRGVSLTADDTALVTVPIDRVSSIWMAPKGDSSRATQILQAKYDGLNGVALAPDGRVVYTSRATGTPNLWIANSDGTNARQLTAHTRRDVWPTVTADGRYVIFSSDRAGTRNIWRIDIDGGNPTQLTHGQKDENPSCSPDGQWVAFTSFDSGIQKLARVSIAGDAVTQLTDYVSFQPVISPDGNHIAFLKYNAAGDVSHLVVAIIAVAGGQPLSEFEVTTRPLRIRWAPDGQALTYLLTRGGISNIWSRPIAGGEPVQLTDFKSDQIYFFDSSRDGRQLVLARGSSTSDVVLITDLR